MRVGGECWTGIPRLYAAASLKRREDPASDTRRPPYSAALCRGLIEAHLEHGTATIRVSGIPRLYAAASLKPAPATSSRWGGRAVFRGFMPRPH